MALFIIWEEVPDRNVADVNVVVGIFDGTWEEAEELVGRMNEEGCGKYWRSEPSRISLNPGDGDYREFLPR